MLRSLPLVADMTLTAPLPPLTVNIARPDMNSTVISVVGNVISLHHDLQKIGGVSTTLSTGGGLMQLGDLRQGVHVFEGGTALLQEHSVDGKKYFAPMLLSVYHKTAHEVRIAGCAWVHVGELLKAACESKSLSVAGCLYANDGTSPIAVVQVEITPDPASAAAVRRWRDSEGKKTFNGLMNRTFDPSQITADLSHFAAERQAALSAKFGATCGNFDKTLSLYSVDAKQDISLPLKVCPLQRELFINAFNAHEDIYRKQALRSAQLVLLTISQGAVMLTGKDTINLKTIEQLLDAKEKNMTLKEATLLTSCFTDAQTRLQDLIYDSDEHFDIAKDGKMTQDLSKVGEKEDLAGGLGFAHYEINVREHRRLQNECAALLLEKSRTGTAWAGEEKLQKVFADMTTIRNNVSNLYGDCEDLANLVKITYAMVKDEPDKMSAMTQPHVGDQVWPEADKGGANFALKQELWPRIWRLISKGMQMHETGEPGGEIDTALAADPTSNAQTGRQTVTRKVVNGICVANGASLQQTIDRNALRATPPMRSDFDDFPAFVKAVCGDKLGGHACPFQIECGPERPLISDGNVEAVCFGVGLYKGLVLEATKPCKQNLDVQFAGPVKKVDVNICMGDKTLDMKAVPLNTAMNTIGQAFQNNLNAHFKKQNSGLRCAVPMDISAASTFYSTFSSLDGHLCVSAELRDDDTGKVSSIRTRDMQHLLDTQPENVRYVGAKLAWDVEFGAESQKTEVLCVKFKPSQRELDMISMVCKEVGQIHRMSKDHFATIMQMNVRLDCGWSGDTYTTLRPKLQSCPTKMPLEILVRTLDGCLSAENVMKCMTTTQLKQHTESILFHHIAAALEMDCAGASFRWINQDFGVVENMVVELGDALK